MCFAIDNILDVPESGILLTGFLTFIRHIMQHIPSSCISDEFCPRVDEGNLFGMFRVTEKRRVGKHPLLRTECVLGAVLGVHSTGVLCAPSGTLCNPQFTDEETRAFLAAHWKH